jgi:hypothetical protein
MTSTVGVDEAAEEGPLAPEPGTVIVLTCDELPDSDPGTVTVRGWGDGAVVLDPDMVFGTDCEEEADPAEPVAGDPYGVS